MKRLAILTIMVFAFGFYMVPATFAAGTAGSTTDSKDATGVRTDTKADSKDATGVRTDTKADSQDVTGVRTDSKADSQDVTGVRTDSKADKGLTGDSKDKQYSQGQDKMDKTGQTQAQSQQGILGQQNLQSQQFGQQKQNLMLVDNLIGSEIQNQQGEKIGDIDSVLVDVENGRIGFVTMSSGGIFGMGGEKYIVPFNALEKNMSQRTEATRAQVGERRGRDVVFTLNRQKDQLKAVPDGDIEDAMTQDGQSRGIHEHYGVSPYWEQDQSQSMQQRQSGSQGQMMPDTKKETKKY